MTKPIALIAPYESTNYGTMLQAYALAHVINGLGYPCEYICYTPHCKNSIWKRIQNYIRRKLGLKDDLSRKLVYTGIDDYSYIFSEPFLPLKKNSQLFSDHYIPHSTICYTPKTIKKCLPKYERFIVGSDQTWSMERYISMKGFYMLPFVKKSTKCFAYAPSLGTTTITHVHADILCSNLKKFSQLSCREKGNCKTLSLLLNCNVHYVLDPTMLITREEWSKMAQPMHLPQKYILAYILGERDCISSFAEKMGKQLGIPVYYVCTRPKYMNTSNHLPIDLTPGQWISVIKNATYVVTDSFHGSVFSIIFNRDFYAFSKREKSCDTFNDNDRIIELLTTFGLENRFISNDDDICNYYHVNYERIMPQLNSLRGNSMSYLQTILQ